MRHASRLFFLAVFALLAPCRGQGAATKSQDIHADSCAIEPNAIVSDACVTYGTLDEINNEIAEKVTSITKDSDFFSYYRLNLFNRECPFWSDATGMCANIACSVTTLDNEEDIPAVWRAEELSKLEGPKAKHPGREKQRARPAAKPLQGELGEDVGESCVVEYDDECDERDYCIREDEGSVGKGDYVSLTANPERFTGYGGVGAVQIWNAIYRENCFMKDPIAPTTPAMSGVFAGGLQAAHDFRGIIKEHSRQQAVLNPSGTSNTLVPDDECLEKRVFYRIVSGMHESISLHLCSEYLNQTTGVWGPNLQCYLHRIAPFPDRISNLYFDYALVLRAVSKLGKHLEQYTFCADDPEQNRETKTAILDLASTIASKPRIFDETLMFNGDAESGLKEDFRNRFRNVSRLMDCIGCDKCRLWGKLQTAGYGTALKVLFDFDETKDGENPPLRRPELVALINTLGRLSTSITAIQDFKSQAADEAATLASASNVAESVQAATSADQPTTDAADTKSDEESQSTAATTATATATSSKQQVAEVHETQAEAKASPLSSVDADEENLADDDESDDYTIEPTPMPSISEQFHEEFVIVVKASIWVVKSWLRFPKTAWQIIVMEINRLWHYWLGLPVMPRTWEFRFPTRDEL